MYAYWIGLSALSTGQRALDVIGQNIANAATPGYHRQRVELASQVAADQYGQGVRVSSVTRFTAPTLRAALLSANGQLNWLASRTDSQSQIQSLIAAGPNSIGALTGNFFSQLDRLSTQPTDPTARRQAVNAAGSLASRFVATSHELDRMRSGLREQAALGVDAINDLTEQIADLNAHIIAVQSAQGTPNDLRDQRDQLVDRLSQMIDIRTVESVDGSLNIIGPGTMLVVGAANTPLTMTTNVDGSVQITVTGSSNVLPIQGGSLGGIITEVNQVIPSVRGQLDTLAGEIIRQLNAVQATGLGTAGPFDLLAGTQRVVNPAAMLDSAGLPFPVQAGATAISVTNLSTNQRQVISVAVDPSTQSLNDLAAAITTATGGQVQATVDGPTGTLRFQAQSGYRFDFAGRLPTAPEAVAMGGTANPAVTGSYTGSSNDRFTFNIVGTGTVGVTPGLQMEVRNSANSLIATLNVGAGYTPGDSLAVADGIQVSLSAGTTINGTFSVPVIAQPDTTGLLAALGVNGLFTGFDASSIALRSDIQADPSLLAVSRTGASGDISNLERFARLRDGRFLAGGTQRFDEYFNALAGGIGVEIQTIGDQHDALAALQDNLAAQEQSATGVDINEETVAMLQYQRLVEASSRYLASVNQALDSILSIIN